MNGECRQIALAIPWFAAGTLPDAQHADVVAHLADCNDCRELLAQARLQLTAVNVEALRAGPIDAALLVQYAEEPESLDPETRHWIESRLESDELAREALRHLREIDAAPLQEATSSVVRPISLWDRLSRSVLQPAPAFVYLAAALVCGALLLGRQESSAPDESGPVLRVDAERTTRGPNDPPTSAPLAIVTGRSSRAPVVLQLITDLSQADIEMPDARFLLTLRERGTVLWSLEKRGHEFFWSPPHAVLGVAIVPSTLQRTTPYDLELSAVKPGDPLDGQVLFRRQLIIRDEP